MTIDEAIERCETLATKGQNIFPRDPDIAEQLKAGGKNEQS